MLAPLRNGVVINLEERRCSHRADVYKLGDEWWIFRYNTNHCYWEEDPDFVIAQVTHLFDEFALHGTMIVHEHDLVLTLKGAKNIGVDALEADVGG